MLKPVTFYNNLSRKRDLDKNSYVKRIHENLNLSDKNLLITEGNRVFQNLSNIIDMTDSLSMDTDVSINSTFSRLRNFTPLNNAKSEFYLKFVPHNGLLSLRRGFYQLVSYPKPTMISKISTWQAEVLYCEGNEDSVIYKYKANIGPLVNRFAVCGNLTTGKVRVLSINSNNKERALTKLLNKVIYVSSTGLVDNEVYANPMKEVLWFTWE